MAQWQTDPYHTQIEFSAKHLGMMTVRGNFTGVTAVGDDYPDDAARSRIQVTIQMGSIQTHNEVRDQDLRSSTFLDVETYPTATFQTTAIEQTGTDEFSVTGDLTIKGVTNPVTLAMARLGEFSDPAMGHRIGYSGGTKIKRKDYCVRPAQRSLSGEFHRAVSVSPGIFAKSQVTALAGRKRMNARSPMPRPTRNLSDSTAW